MPVTFDLDSVEGVAIGVARGKLDPCEIRASAETMWRLAEGPVMRMLWDLREARFDLAASEIRDFADFVRESAPPARIRNAIVLSDDLEFGLARMFEVFRETEGAETSVFRDLEQALAWVTHGAA